MKKYSNNCTRQLYLYNNINQSRVFILVWLAMATIAGCEDNAKESVDVECTSNADCLANTDGRTECDIINGVCLAPQKECTSNMDCVARTDGKTECDILNGVCLAPQKECTSNMNCAARTDGKTECDILNGVCVSPAKECTFDADCSGNTVSGKIKCKTDQGVCIQPCGDGFLDVGEDCESANLNGMTCTNLPEGRYLGGNLSCNASCGFNKTGCYECTDDDVSKCPADKPKCASGTCIAQDYVITCGDGVAEGKEKCDVGNGISDFHGITCADFGFKYGELGCRDCAAFVLDGCFECKDSGDCSGLDVCENGTCVAPAQACSNGLLEAGESCDKSQLNGKTCADLGYLGGNLSCNASCDFDKTGCYECTNDDITQCPADKQKCTSGTCVAPDHVITCGDGIAEGKEKCDVGNGVSDFHGMTCADFGYKYGNIGCQSCTSFKLDGCYECKNSSDCSSSDVCESGTCVAPAQACSNGLLEAGESCDKTNLNDASCVAFGFLGGDLKCNAGCEYDKSACYECTKSNTSKCRSGQICSDNGRCIDPAHEITCGDGLIEGNEECEKDDMNGRACADFGNYAAGTLTCDSNCHYVTTGCYECANDMHCKDNTVDGRLVCNTTSHVCVLPTPVCGNGKIEAGESCDKTKLNGKSCESLGFLGGNLLCNAGCEFDKSKCYECLTDEDCKTNPNGSHCADSGYCVQELHVITCGDGIVEGDEQCDGGNLNGKTCIDRGFVSGTLACSNCTYETTGCYECLNNTDCNGNADGRLECNLTSHQCVKPICGNGKLEIGEECDGTLFVEGKSAACSEWGDYNQGTVSCSNCHIDSSQCSKIDCHFDKGQVWSDQYNTCVYHINTEADLKNIADAWYNGTYVNKYPGLYYDAPVFVLKDDMSIPKEIGTTNAPFNGVLYGEGHMLTTDYYRLFGSTKDAIVQDLTLNYTLNRCLNTGNFAERVTGGMLKNISLNLNWTCTSGNENETGFVAEVNGATLEDIEIKYQANLDAYKSAYYYHLFVRNSENSIYRRISLRGEALSKDGFISGLAHTSKNDQWTDCEIDLDVSTGNGNIYSLFKNMSGNTTINRVNIKKFNVAKYDSCDSIYYYNDGVLIGDGTDCTACTISNLQDHSKYSHDCRNYFVYNPGVNMQIVNASLYGNYDQLAHVSYLNKLLEAKLANVLLASYSGSIPDIPENYTYVYFSSDTQTADTMNKHLADKTGIPSGTYLPWTIDHGRIVLKFDANDGDLYVVP
ncbi:MAG: hypothetical protein J6A01_00960 [Proteobacteria bacterium]|nr:hypothetical protein [Pseudomonadota bacterium]